MQWSDIEWTDATWGVVHGCTRVSRGCENCYAERISRQYGHTEHPWEPEHAEDVVQLKPEKLDEPLSWPATSPQDWGTFPYADHDAPPSGDHPVRVFVNSMSDLFHSQVPESFIADVLEVCRQRPEHVYQILTKRPGRAAHLDLDWPENVWLGTSVEDADVVERIDLLRDADAETLFVSFEPLLGPIEWVDFTRIDWAIVGGESGPDGQRREMDSAWARELHEACIEQSVPFFFKQHSGRHHGAERYLHEAEFGLGRKFEEYPALPESTRALIPEVTQTHAD